MLRFHPQWVRTTQLLKYGAIGELRSIQTAFSYYDDHAQSIVNNKAYGGGSLMDIGCYPISLSRYLYDAEPDSVSAVVNYHPEFKVDILTTAILNFGNSTSSFFSSIQMAGEQSVRIFGTEGRIEIEVPFNPKSQQSTKIWLKKSSEIEEIILEACDQYGLQIDAFSQAIINDTQVPTPLQDAVNNMRVIDKIVESDRIGRKLELAQT